MLHMDIQFNHMYMQIQRKTGLALWISEKVDFRTRKITTNKEENHIMINRSITQEDNNLKCTCPEELMSKIHEGKTDRTEKI